MASATSIEWTDASWNPVAGCDKISPGCAHCYAEVMGARLRAMALTDIAAGRDPGRKRHYIEAIDEAGRWTGKLIPVPEALDDPRRWRKPRRVFVNSMSDLFHESVPFDFVDRVFQTMAGCPQHTFQILTKRAARMAGYFLTTRPTVKTTCGAWPLPNVWLGTSVEDQQRADERIPWLLKCPAAVRFLSCEPLLGPLDLWKWLVPGGRADWQCQKCGGFFAGRGDCPHCHAGPIYSSGSHVANKRDPLNRFTGHRNGQPLDWVIVGGESGHDARPCDIAWSRWIVGQCKHARTRCFVKQLGANVRGRNDHGWENATGDEPNAESWPTDDIDAVEHNPDGWREDYQGAPVRVRLRDKKGGDWNEWPADLRVRQYPAEGA